LPVFETADQLYACIGGLFVQMQHDLQTQEQLSELKLSVQFTFLAPEATISVITGNGEQQVKCDAQIENPDVELAMSGDVAHHFWMGEVNVMDAITKRLIIPVGSLAKIMTLVPLIKATIRLYPQHYQACRATDG